MRKEWMMAGLMLAAPVIAVAQTATTPDAHKGHAMKGKSMTPAPTTNSSNDAAAMNSTAPDSGTNAVDAMDAGTETMNESSSMGSNAAQDMPPPK